MNTSTCTTTTLSVGEFAGRPEEWNRFVRDQTEWTHCHLHEWKTLVEEVYGHDCVYLAARDSRNDHLRAVLPLVRVKSLLFGHYLVSVPFLNYGGPLGDPEAVARVVQSAVDQTGTDGVDLLELRSRHEIDVLDLSVSHRKITVLLDLPTDDPEALWDNLKSKVRSQVRRPRKEGIEVRFGHDQIGAFYEVFSHHMRDLGTPAQPIELFERAAELFGEEAWIGCAYHENTPVACGYGFCWEREIEMTWASALRDYSRMAPNMLLYWAFMERAIHEGLETFNFGRCTPGGGTHRFKKQWGTHDQQLWWYQYSPANIDSTPSPDDEAYDWGQKLWRRLPVPVSRALGPKIVKYIP